MTTTFSAHALYIDTLNNGGASYSLDTLAPETRPLTLVGGAQDANGVRIPERSIPLDDWTPLLAERAILELRAVAPLAYIGTWIENGAVIVDASDSFETLDAALIVASARGERAVYTVGTGETLTTAPATL